METIAITGYTANEKFCIAKNSLVPAEVERIGLNNNVVIRDEVLQRLASTYCLDPGVRSLKKLIQSTFAKACYNIATSDQPNVVINVDIGNFEKYIDASPPSNKRYYQPMPVGVAMGLMSTSLGGVIQYVECTPNVGEKEGSFKATGNMGEILSESISIAYTFARSYLSKVDGNNSFFLNNAIHIHLPAGSMSKDTSTCGAAVVTALLSLAMCESVAEIAILGEITLSGGIILPIHSVKEKVITAQINRITEIILPMINKGEWDDLEDIYKEGINCIHFVENYDQIFNIVFKRS